MMDATTLKVGDVFYGVKSNGNFHRNKIYRKIDGEEWFKYDTPRVDHFLITYNVMGILKKTIEGAWSTDQEYELSTEIYLRSQTEKDIFPNFFTMFIDDFADKHYFVDKDEALAHIEMLNEKDREFDRL
jgi:hypothetical protein